MNSAEMACRELVTLVTDYLEDMLDPDDRRRFEEHVAECDGCAAYIEQMRLTIATVGSIEPDDLDPAVRTSLLNAFRGWKAGRRA